MVSVVYVVLKQADGKGVIDSVYPSMALAIRHARRLAIQNGMYGVGYPFYEVRRVPIEGVASQGRKQSVVWRSSQREVFDPKSSERIIAYVDGACQTTDPAAIGGWAVIVHVPERGVVYKLRGSERGTTSQRMELTAPIRLFEELVSLGICEKSVVVVSDSQYLIDGMNVWLPRWISNGWKGAGSKTEVKNTDLWKRLIEVTKGFDVTWKKIPRSSHELQKEADHMAKRCLGEDLGGRVIRETCTRLKDAARYTVV